MYRYDIHVHVMCLCKKHVQAKTSYRLVMVTPNVACCNQRETCQLLAPLCLLKLTLVWSTRSFLHDQAHLRAKGLDRLKWVIYLWYTNIQNVYVHMPMDLYTMYTCTVDPRNKVVELDMQCMLNIFRDYHPRSCEFNQFSKYSKYTPVCALLSSLWCKMRVPY